MLFDRFLVGVNLPWFDYGGDFGANAWRPQGGLASPDRLSRAREGLKRVADTGATAVRWFLLCDGRAGLAFDGRGAPNGVDDRFFPDLDCAIDLLGQTNLSAMFVLFDFLWFARRRVEGGVQLGGRSRIVADDTERQRLLDTVVAPILDRYGRERAILAWDILNEPEWAITRLPFAPRGIRHQSMLDFIREAARLIHERTVHFATVGTARPATLPLLNGLGLDFYQVHWYDKPSCNFDLAGPVARFETHCPLLLGEFPTRGASASPVALMETARRAGYAGAFAWSAYADDEASDPDALAEGIRAITEH